MNYHNRNGFKTGLFSLLLMLGAGQTFGQDLPHSLLWQISGNGLAEVSYLFGTVHLMEQADFNVRKEVDSAFNRSEAVAFELKLDDFTMLAKMQQWSALPNGTTLHNYCSNDEYNKLSNYLRDSLHTDIASFNTQKPFFLYQSITTAQLKGETASFEYYFLEKCMKEAKPVLGLEPIEAQLHVFDTIPYDEQIDWMVQSIDASAVETTDWKSMVTAYNNEDLEALAHMLNDEDPVIKKHEDLFLINRNTSWIPVIAQITAKQSTFIAVGAAHLIGPNGLIRLLQQQGYTLTPILPSDKQ